MSIPFTLVVFFGALTLLVFVHELGHFLPAKLFGMRVEKFYIFFDWPRKLWSTVRGGTEFGIGVLPLGGYVKIGGMIDESLDDEAIKQEKAGVAPQPDDFRAKPVWQRMIVMVGGVTFNVLLAIAIFAGIKTIVGEARVRLDAMPLGLDIVPGTVGAELGLQTGDRLIAFKDEPITYLPDGRELHRYLITPEGRFTIDRGGQRLELPVPDDYLDRVSSKRAVDLQLGLPDVPPVVIVPDSVGPGARAGLKTGDRILRIDSSAVATFGQMRSLLRGRPNAEVSLTLQRGAEQLLLTARLDSTARLQVAPDLSGIPVERITYNFFEALGPGSREAFGIIGQQISGFQKIFAGDVSASKAVAGPIKIAGAMGEVTRTGGALGWWQMVALLSMALAFVNILPIPALDGGHLVFLLIEAIMRREPSLKVRLIAQQVGMVIVLSLMAFVIFNDTITSIWQ